MKCVNLTTKLIIGCSLFALTGCAPTSVFVRSEYGGRLQQPDQILVFNFSTSPEEVKLDEGVTSEVKSLVKGTRTPKTEEELKVGHAVSDSLAKKLVQDLRKLGYPANRASIRPPAGEANVLLIEGQIYSIDEGNRAERVVIGLGAGRTDVKAYTQIYFLRRSGKFLVEQLQTDAKSGYKPGMAETEGASIAAGHWAVGLAVGAGLSAGSEVYGANVDADAERTAKDISKQLNDFFVSKGWVPTLPLE
jgi:hypothetical protein